jgi:hypothetical protein
VSLRELARGERMSRYKLNRLLTAAGIRPVHRGRQSDLLRWERSPRGSARSLRPGEFGDQPWHPRRSYWSIGGRFGQEGAPGVHFHDGPSYPCSRCK